MGAIKPWHLLALCCLLSTATIVAGGVWAVRWARRRR
jgi:hypothetical protein